KQPANKGEYYLTDAFQYMIDHGARIKVVDVEGWYDAGKLDTLLDTNRAMLERGHARRPERAEGSTIIDPVYIESGVVLKDSTVGPNVSILAGAVIERSTVRDSLVGGGARISDCVLKDSLVGDDVVLEGVEGAVTVGDQSEVRSRRK
ncbi:MAG TPA: hypothetical protein VIB98_05525, partial [Gemmatimonadaceae bacterium]